MGFKDGDRLSQIHFPDGTCFKAGSRLCDQIVVTMEPGHTGEDVAWFELRKNGRVISKWNSAHVAGVFL